MGPCSCGTPRDEGSVAVYSGAELQDKFPDRRSDPYPMRPGSPEVARRRRSLYGWRAGTGIQPRGSSWLTSVLAVSKMARESALHMVLAFS